MAVKRTDFEQLQGILDQFDTDTILAVAKSRLGVGPHIGGTLVIPPIVVHPAASVGTEVMAQDKSTDCGPKSTSATKWGDWNQDEKEADKSARQKAREAAGAACGGKCDNNQTCKYMERSHELLETETNSEQNVTSYRTKARSSGMCQCE